MNSLLEGITVLDFSEYIAGPYCGFLLADMGARVIKVEPPDGAEERRQGNVKRYRGNTRMLLAYNRGKESISVNLKTPQGQKVIHQLVESADVIVQNFVPGAAVKLGIDYETLAAINDQIIFVSSTAFGEVGPHKTRKGFDIIAHAASGIMSNYSDETGEPRGPGGLPYIDMSTGIYNALGVVSALYHRTQTGVGQKLETSLFSTGLALQSTNFLHIDELDDNIRQTEESILQTAQQDGKSHTQIIDEFAQLRLRDDQPETERPIEVPDCLHRPTDRQVNPYYRVYPTAKGYLSIAALNVTQRQKLCSALNVVDEFSEINAGNISDQAYFAQKATMKEIEKSLRMQPREYWVEKLEAIGVPCGPVNYRSDLYQDDQARALGMVWELENSEVGSHIVSGNPIRFSKTPIKPSNGAPTLGEHTERVLDDFGFSEQEINSLSEKGVIR